MGYLIRIPIGIPSLSQFSPNDHVLTLSSFNRKRGRNKSKGVVNIETIFSRKSENFTALKVPRLGPSDKA
jgi:hypothetical protein